MKKIVLNGLLLIATVMSMHTIFCMEDPVENSGSLGLTQLFSSDADSMNTHLNLLSCYASALLLQDEIINNMRIIMELRKKYDIVIKKIHEECGLSSDDDFKTGLLIHLREYETLIMFTRYSILSSFNDFEKRYSDDELCLLKNLKLKMENSDNKELKILALFCEKNILKEKLVSRAKVFLRLINECHIYNSQEGKKNSLYEVLSIKNDSYVSSLFDSKMVQQLNNINYNDLVRGMDLDPDNCLKFGSYSYILRIYDALSSCGKQKLECLHFFIDFEKEGFVNSSDLIQEVQPKLDLYDENKSNYIQVYQEILAFLKQEVKNDYSMRDVLNIQECSSRGKPSSRMMLMPEIFPEMELDQEVVENDSNDFLPDYLKKSIKKGSSKAKQRAKGKGKGRGKNTGKPKPQVNKKSPSLQPLQPQKTKKAIIPKRASDGSFVLEDNEDYMVVEDPKNNMKVRVLKSDQKNSVSFSQSQLNELGMTNWVKDWYEKPQFALDYQGYKTPGNQKYTSVELNDQVIAYHTPALILLKHFKALAEQRTIESRRVLGKQDILFTMPIINFYNDKKINSEENWQSGVVAWIVDAKDKKTIYHAEFRPTSVSKMIQNFVQDGYFQISFPTLSEVQEYNQQ